MSAEPRVNPVHHQLWSQTSNNDEDNHDNDATEKEEEERTKCRADTVWNAGS